MDVSGKVKAQYQDDKNLSVRIRLHARHSTNRQGFVPWLFEQYDFSACRRILELGCGNGNQWEGRIGLLPKEATLTLSDFSMGMVEAVFKRYGGFNHVLMQRVDIQDIPFPAGSFDAVIANHMLYHVPDLGRALSEVSRVLSPVGSFYAATNGNGGMRPYLHDALRRVNPQTAAFTETFPFSLQSGQAILAQHFGSVRRVDYEDSLCITHTQDLIDWIASSMAAAELTAENFADLYDYFEGIRQAEGAIRIPKEQGLFIAAKE